MQITVQITGLDALVAAINNLRLPAAAPVFLVPPTPAPAIDMPVAEKPAKKAKAAPAPLPELTSPEDVAQPAAPDMAAEISAMFQPVAETPAPAPAARAEAMTPENQINNFDMAKKLVLEISRIHGRDAAANLLAGFGAERLSAISADTLPALIARATDLLAA